VSPTTANTRRETDPPVVVTLPEMGPVFVVHAPAELLVEAPLEPPPGPVPVVLPPVLAPLLPGPVPFENPVLVCPLSPGLKGGTKEASNPAPGLPDEPQPVETADARRGSPATAPAQAAIEATDLATRTKLISVAPEPPRIMIGNTRDTASPRATSNRAARRYYFPGDVRDSLA
jgi:hypothetical protein